MSAFSSLRQIAYSLLALVASLLLFESTPLDLSIQALLYDRTNQQWIWSGAERVTRLLLYDGAKAALVVFWLALGIGLLFGRRWSLIRRNARGLRIVFLSLFLVPACVAGLKSTTNVACPRNLVEFGGDVAYVGIFGSYDAENRPAARQRCFPAAHASGGFALLSLFFLFRGRRNRRRAVIFAIAAGWVTGAYKMAIGDHFLSHTVVTMVLAWLIVNVVAAMDARASLRGAGACGDHGLGA